MPAEFGKVVPLGDLRCVMHDDLAFTQANLGLPERGLGRRSEAEAQLRKALAVAQAHKHRNLAPILAELADLLCDRRAFAEGLSALDRAAPIMKADYPDDPWRSARVANTRGGCMAKSGNPAEGRRLIDSSMAEIRKRWKPDSMFGQMAEQRLGLVSGLSRK